MPSADATNRRLALVRLAPWMHVESAHPRDLLWPVALLHARAHAAGVGWSTRIIDQHVEEMETQHIAEELVRFGPRVLLIETSSTSFAGAWSLASAVAQAAPGMRIWGVGQHASEAPEDFLRPDSPFRGVIRGESDAAVLPLLETDGDGPVDGTAMRLNGAVRTFGERLQLADLDTVPPLDPAGLPLDRYGMKSLHVPALRRQRWGYLLTSRGCMYRCTFCSPTLRQSYGTAYRAAGAERVVAEMERLHRQFGVTAFYMIDDLFSFDRQRVLEICALLERRRLKVRWAIQTRADMLDPDVLSALKAAGCCAIKMGVESGVDRILRKLRKGESTATIARAADWIRAAGISLTACFMVGNPDETLADIEATYRFARRLRADMIQVAVNTPYPGSAMYSEYGEEIKDLAQLTHYNLHDVNLSRVDDATLDRAHRSFYLRYYLSPRVFFNYLRRRGIYRLARPDEWALALGSLRYLLRRRRG